MELIHKIMNSCNHRIMVHRRADVADYDTRNSNELCNIQICYSSIFHCI
ncbi:MAG: hypothetical protein MJY89_00655 [Bacteroidales bacterium]|nr:hypothetical protein [Bacteroidales bacterium]